MSRLSKRAAVYIDGEPLRNIPVYRVDGVDGDREVIVNMARVSKESVEEMPDVVDVEWTGYEYVAGFKGVTDNDNLIYSFELQTSAAPSPY